MSTPKIQSSHSSEARNIINQNIEVTNQLAKSVQNLVARGQLTAGQYSELIKTINAMVSENDFNDFKKESAAVQEAIIKEYELIINDSVVKNLFTLSGSVKGTINETSGNINEHNTNIVTDYIPVNGTTDYSFYRKTDGLFKVVWYDANKNIISGLSWQETRKHHIFRSPSLARYVRINLGVGVNVTENSQSFILNIGKKSFDEETHYKNFWENIPRPSLTENSVSGKHVMRKSLTHEHVDFINETGSQLFDKSAITHNRKVNNDGEIVIETERWLSDFIPFNANNRTISIKNAPTSVVISVYDSDKKWRMNSGFNGTYTIHEAYTEEEKETYFRISGRYDHHPIDSFMLNYGSQVLPYEEISGPKIDPKYLPDSVNVNIDDIISQLPSHSVKQPYPPKLTLEEVHVGREQPLWLSEDGKVLYGSAGTQVLISTDEWKTHTQIGNERLPMTVMGIRELNDGELLASATRNEAQNIKAKLYKTRGFDRSNAGNCTWEEVHEVKVKQANVRNDWGMDVYGDIVLISEYGLRGLEGARHAYISNDNGETFKVMFDLVNVNATGRPKWDEQAHIHTIAFDPYFSRIWICVGDSANTAVYYSDNYGGDWKFVPGSERVQFTGIIAMENHVIFGTDGAPNGVYVYNRKDRATTPKIEPLLIINDDKNLTHVFGLPFRRKFDKDVPVFFNAPVVPYADNNATLIIGFVDGYKAHILYEGEKKYNVNDGTGFTVALGETANGNIIISSNEPGKSNPVTYKAKAPTWK